MFQPEVWLFVFATSLGTFLFCALLFQVTTLCPRSTVRLCLATYYTHIDSTPWIYSMSVPENSCTVAICNVARLSVWNDYICRDLSWVTHATYIILVCLWIKCVMANSTYWLLDSIFKKPLHRMNFKILVYIVFVLSNCMCIFS